MAMAMIMVLVMVMVVVMVMAAEINATFQEAIPTNAIIMATTMTNRDQETLIHIHMDAFTAEVGVGAEKGVE